MGRCLIALTLLAGLSAGPQASTVYFGDFVSASSAEVHLSLGPHITGYKDGGGGEGVAPGGGSANYARYANGPSLLFINKDRGTSLDVPRKNRHKQLTPVPVPAAAWLFGSGLLGLGFLSRRRRKSIAEANNAQKSFISDKSA